MSNSPFEVFRRNLKPLMVLLTLLAIFAFVVLPVVDSYMRQNAGVGGDRVLATYDGTKLTESRVKYFTESHYSTVQFLQQLAQEAMRRKADPNAVLFGTDQAGNISVGINSAPSWEGSIQTLMLASQAKSDGFELDDSAVQSWLEAYTDGKMTESEIISLWVKSTNRRLGRPHLYEQLRTHLLARVYRERGFSGLFLGRTSLPLLTPDEEWGNFLKLQRSAMASAYGIRVADYMKDTDENPSESEIQKVYDEGKDRDLNPQSPEPAFHRRYEASFEYVAADFRAFIDEEVKTLEEEKIREEYERRINEGEFQVPTDRITIPTNDETNATTTDEGQPESEGNETSTGDDAGTEAASSEGDNAASDDASTPAEATETAAELTEPAGTETETSPSESESTESEGDEGSGADDSSESGDQSSVSSSSAVRLVAMQQEEEGGSEPGEEAGEEPESTQGSESGQPATESGAEDSSSTEGDKAGDEEETTAAADTTDETADAADDPAPAADDGAPSEGGTPSAEVKQNPNPPAEPEVEKFEDVRQQIAESMVADEARKKMDAAINRVVEQMQQYFDAKQFSETPPERPDLKKLADELGLTYEEIGPFNALSIRQKDMPIADSIDLPDEAQFSFSSPSFVDLMFGPVGNDMTQQGQPLFAPIQTVSLQEGKTYASWKVDETQAYTPSLDQVRDEVVEAVQLQQARQFALEAAKGMIEKAKAEGVKSLKDIVPEDKQDLFEEGLGPFTWMNSFGRAGVTIGNVPKLNSVGDDFMEAVFTSDREEMKAALNQPGDVVYIVQPTLFQPSINELQERFKQPGQRREALMLGNNAGPILDSFFEDIDETADFRDLMNSEQ